jgi:hypothetical protein|tara:strand:- start:1253 stop:1516 length:264 start_codon:yes stop_codon:yes gene_type:complete
MPHRKIEGVYSVDGFKRTHEAEKELNKLFASLFKDKIGTEILKYLKSITLNIVSGPEVSNEKLRHLEGSRYIVGIIEQRIERGKRDG